MFVSENSRVKGPYFINKKLNEVFYISKDYVAQFCFIMIEFSHYMKGYRNDINFPRNNYSILLICI